MPLDSRPGLDPRRLARLIRRAVEACGLDLDGVIVLTEAATGAYVVTPVIAAHAGAGHVHAVTRSTRYGTAKQVCEQTIALADALGVTDRITVHDRLDADLLQTADVVTNSGHLRPLNAERVAMMRTDAVVPLMFEAWEIGQGRADLDLDAMRARGIRFAGTNERHPAVDVFADLGHMAAALLLSAGVSVRLSRVGVLCDNPFREHVVRGLGAIGADVLELNPLTGTQGDSAPDLDALVVAMTPTGGDVVPHELLRAVHRRNPAVVLAQLWGDVDRAGCAELGVICVPADPPPAGHMGVLPSVLGPEPVVRLQTGGLRVAAALRTPPDRLSDADLSFLYDV